jgi:hypothetical protein
VLVPARVGPAIADGSVSVLFRRWRRPQVVAGRVYRTAAGRLLVERVDVVSGDRITAADARRSGFRTPDEVRAVLRGDPSWPVYRLHVRAATDPDPRSALAADDVLSADEVAALARRLDRLDRASSHGPWTAQTLELIRTRPAVRAPDLAASVGRETLPFKVDVRKLKNLGLTHSLRVGYELSPRGVAFLAATAPARAPA